MLIDFIFNVYVCFNFYYVRIVFDLIKMQKSLFTDRLIISCLLLVEKLVIMLSLSLRYIIVLLHVTFSVIIRNKVDICDEIKCTLRRPICASPFQKKRNYSSVFNEKRSKSRKSYLPICRTYSCANRIIEVNYMVILCSERMDSR